MTDYRLRAIRLVNFHNFVDETIEVRDGGHLFLLGDNGSGKTTVLDAVHFVLAGGELELNAAARVGGRRDDGRSLQGVVLRYDFERGVRNDGGAIAYAAIELVDPDSGRRISLGVGAEATTMEARVAKWGFIVPAPLAEIALLDGEERPLDRDALRRQLGGAHVYAPLAGYRKELARRLFASEAQYDEVVRFWGMAKAYREIVAGARDFGALFERLLPTPDGAVFGEILKTLRAIDDLEVALRDLDGQRAYVGGLADRVRDVAVAREAAARYRWLACGREHDEALAAGRREAEFADEHTRAAERLRLDAEAARLRSEGSDEVLRQAEGADSAGVLGALRDLETQRSALSIEVDRARVAADDCRRARDGASGLAAAAREKLGSDAVQLAAELRAAHSAVAELPGDLAGVARLADQLERIAAPGATKVAELPDSISGATEAEAMHALREHAVVDARVLANEAAGRRTDRAAELAALESSDATAPILGGAFAAARRALADVAIANQPLYELLEPTDGADPALLAAIESLAGEAVLGALVVAADDRHRARELVAAAAPGVRVVVESCDVALPSWCASALAPVNDVARSTLAAALIQPTGLGGVEPPHTGDVALRGLGHRVEHDQPRWLGAGARRRAHEARLATAREAVAAAEQAEHDAAHRVGVARLAMERAHTLVRAIARGTASLTSTWHDAATATHRETLAAAAHRDVDQRVTALADRLAALDAQRDALRARTDGVDLDELDRRLAVLREQATTARDRWLERVGAHATALSETRSAADRSRAALARAADLMALLDDVTRALRRALIALGADPYDGDDAALDHHVRVTLRGDSFRSLDTLRQRIADEERAADLAAAELEGDGSRGVRFLAHAARFGFGYDRLRNHIEDRRGAPLAGVLTELDRSIAEQRSVVNERTRTLMDTLVMGELARHLQGQVHHLHETVKGINRVLRDLRFGSTAYQFQVTQRPDRAELIDLVRRLSILDEDSRRQFRAWIDARLDELRATDEQVPPLLDYRRWFEFKLRMSTTDAEGIELTHKLRQVGSGGEQGVPNYLLVLALAKLMFDAAGAAVRPLLFDEAFYGIDASRRDQLLRVATDLGLQLLVASPDQDGATPAVHHATTLFVLKDEDHDVHLAPYHYWNTAHAPQADLFTAPPDPTTAECRPPS